MSRLVSKDSESIFIKSIFFIVQVFDISSTLNFLSKYYILFNFQCKNEVYLHNIWSRYNHVNFCSHTTLQLLIDKNICIIIK